ncbi:hypothetical protein BDY19DRAFT_350322 [Irpex rosettiformis]|uniref:Uncharacterized protein n=1 Tax=Irpex rosettiformis TaxID=378272 RepID=A0ACB8TX62_9APHY|nr:hypothetical protein BDY19DRAFT_350322 [Irpex rosettiformis]
MQGTRDPDYSSESQSQLVTGISEHADIGNDAASVQFMADPQPDSVQAIGPTNFQLATGSLAPVELIRIPRPQGGSQQHRRYAEFPDIEFWVNNRKGVRLYDALHGNFSGLVDADNQVMHSSSVKVTYLIEWPGYRPLKKQKIAQRKFGVQCRSRIARQVAEIVEEFLDERSGCAPYENDWKLGPGFIEYASIYLMELKRISLSTWAAKLAYSSTI